MEVDGQAQALPSAERRAMLIFKSVIFLLATLGIGYISRASLLAPRSHGFYRFFAWEAILALTLLNLDASSFGWSKERRPRG